MSEGSCGTDAPTVRYRSPTIEHGKVELKLYGYMKKHVFGAMGLYKSWVRYWFLHNDNTCQLYYFSSSNEDTAKGAIDISGATFSFQPERAKQGEFTISGSEEHLMCAGTQDSMMQWINQLQQKRNNFNSQTVVDFTQSTVLLSGITDEEDATNTGGTLKKGSTANTAKDTASRLKSWIYKPRKEGGSTFHSTSQERIDAVSVTSLASEESECSKCKDAQWAAFKLQKNIDDLTLSNSNYEDLVKELSQKYAHNLMKVQSEDGQVETIALKDQIISDLKRKLMTYSGEVDMLREEKQGLITDLKEREGKIVLNEQLIEIKDQVVRNLTKDLPSSLEKEKPANSTSYFYSNNETVIGEEELEKLRDMNEAYAMQMNYFQGEILQLQMLRKVDSTKITEQHLEYEDLRAQHTKLSINYRIMMREYDKFMGGSIPQDSVDLIGQIKKETEPYISRDVCNDPDKVMEEDKVPRAELQEMKENVNAYISQNKLLEDEILQLTNLRHEERKRAHQQEAELMKINNHYLLLLREINKLRTGAETCISENLQEIAASLIEQVQDKDLMEVQKVDENVSAKYDRYGFEINKLYRIVKDQNEILWERYVIQYGKEFHITQELKSLIRAGVPHRYRALLWRSCIKRATQYAEGKEESGYYKSLLSRHGPAANAFMKQIDLDLLRTLPTNCLFNNPTAAGISKLRNVLLAFSRHDLNIGYCQGLNRIAAFALTVLGLKEEDAFWCVVTIVAILPPDYYSRTMVGAQVDQRVLYDIISEKYPKIISHFTQLNIDLSLITFNWFLTLFVDNTNIPVILSFWDSFLFEGDKVLYRYALAMFRIHQDQLMACVDAIGVYNFCRMIGESEMCNPQNIREVAFFELNPFPMKRIEERREFHLKKVLSELSDLEVARAAYNNSKSRPSILCYESDHSREEEGH